jgi:uncharacterized protein YbaR (Trm112 family)
MISQDLLDILRCPIDPTREARLTLQADRLLCQRCAVRFPIKDGFPVMVIDEAELPSACRKMEELPCQRAAALPTEPSAH